jgi:hypothetical protein
MLTIRRVDNDGTLPSQGSLPQAVRHNTASRHPKFGVLYSQGEGENGLALVFALFGYIG